MEAALRVSHARLPFAQQRLGELAQSCGALDAAIAATSACEATRRTAVLEQRMLQEALQRLSQTAYQKIEAHYSGQMPFAVAEALGGTAAQQSHSEESLRQ